MERPLRILIHAGNFAPEPTGIGKYTGEMAAWMAARAHQVQVITGFPYYPEWKLDRGYDRTRFATESWQGVQVHRVPHYIPRDGRVTSLRRMVLELSFFMSSSVRWLGVLLARQQPDFIIAVCPPLFSGVWPAIIGVIRRTPWIYHVQDFQLDAAQKLGMIKPGLLGRLLGSLERALLKSATAVSSITPAMCRHAVSKGAPIDRVMELPNWSDIDGIRPSARDNEFRRALNIKNDQMLVMYAGAMGRKQGLDLVLDAAAQLQGDARFRFAMIGSGSDAQQLIAESQSRGLQNIHFLPVQSIDRLNDMLAAGDIHLVVQKANAADLVMPSKLTNILAAGRPAVVTAEAGTTLADVVHHARAGVVVAPESVSSMVQALIDLADDAGRRAEYGRNARAYAEHHLDQDVIMAQFEHQLYAMASCPLRRLPLSDRAGGKKPKSA